jgi:hypothetical protein
VALDGKLGEAIEVTPQPATYHRHRFPTEIISRHGSRANGGDRPWRRSASSLQNLLVMD